MPHINSLTPSIDQDPTTQIPTKPRTGDRSFDAPSKPVESSQPSDTTEQSPELTKPRPGDRSFAG